MLQIGLICSIMKVLYYFYALISKSPAILANSDRLLQNLMNVSLAASELLLRQLVLIKVHAVVFELINFRA